MKRGIPTFVKWAGGKKQLLDQLKLYFPKNFDAYFEPFVGGGSVAFYVIDKYNPSLVFLSDVNEDLINTYKVVKENVEELILALEEYEKNHLKGNQYYYQIRDSQNPDKLSKVQKAARFIYLNRTCFNGLYRVNSKGEFNVPIGSYKKPSICQKEELQEISRLLNKPKKIIIKKQDFRKALSNISSGSFVYCDPPYFPIKKGKSFTKYNKDDFFYKEHEILSRLITKLHKKKCKVLLSNSCVDEIKELYPKPPFYQEHIKAKRMINCIGSKRGEINELLIFNYKLLEVQNAL